MTEAGQLFLVGVFVYLAAGAVKGLLGIGLPTLAVGLMAQFVEAREAITLVIMPMIAANAWQVLRSGPPVAVVRRSWASCRALAVSMLLVLGLVALVAPQVPERLVTAVLGTVVTLFAATSLWRQPPPLPARLDLPAQLAAGTIAGVLGGISGIWAPPVIVYLSTRRLGPAAFVETTGVLLFAGSVVLGLGYAASGLLTADLAARSAAMIPAAITGYAFGERYRHGLSGPRFRTLVLGFFLLMGLNLVRRALSGTA